MNHERNNVNDDESEMMLIAKEDDHLVRVVAHYRECCEKHQLLPPLKKNFGLVEIEVPQLVQLLPAQRVEISPCVSGDD